MRFRRFNLLVPVMVLTGCVAALAQGPTYHLGRTATEQEIKAWDISIGPAGKELPPGSGTAKEGEKIYAKKCAVCHGPTGAEHLPYMGDFDNLLVGGQGTLTGLDPVLTIGSFWPYATTLWDWINRAMPLYIISSSPDTRASSAPGRQMRLYGKKEQLSADEVYALTALLLYRNDIIRESDVIDAKSLPKIRMPNRDGFFPAKPEWKPGFYQIYFRPEPIPRKKKP